MFNVRVRDTKVALKSTTGEIKETLINSKNVIRLYEINKICDLKNKDNKKFKKTNNKIGILFVLLSKGGNHNYLSLSPKSSFVIEYR